MKAIKFLLITIIVASWIFSGWPQIYNFPPMISSAEAATSFVACGVVVEVNNGDMASVGIPTGIANDDILITYVHTRDNIDSTMLADWTNNVAGNDGANNRLEIFWKRITGTESAPTVTRSGGNSGIARMCAFRGIDTVGDPFNVVGSVQTNAGSPISTTAITTTVDGAMILHIFGSQDDNTWGSYTGTPINGAAQNAFDGQGSNDSSSGLVYGLQVSAGSTGLAGAIQTARGPDAGASVQLALRPPDTTAPAAVADLVAFNPTTSSLNLSWTAPGDDNNSGIATSYDIRYSTSNITDANFNSATQASGEPAPSVAGSSESMTVTGLSSNTTYYFAMKTSDEAPNESGLSNITNGTTSAEPSVPSAAPSAPSSGVAPRRATFFGRAYPGSTIEVLRKSTADELFKQTPTESTIINEDGSFYISYTGILGADYLFALQIKDQDGRSTGILAYNISLFGDVFEVKDILIPPTIGFNKSLVAKNEAVKIMGYAIPNSVVELEIDGSKYKESRANQSGFWSFDVSALNFNYGDHGARVRQTTPDKLSNFSLMRTFKLSSLLVPKADFNSDGAVNIRDWSIFLFRWGSSDAQLRLQNDLNADGSTNILDFSIFLAAMKI